MNNWRPLKLAALMATLSLSGTLQAQEAAWYLRAHGGISQVDDTDGTASGFDAGNGRTEIDLDSGFFAGAAVGYRYGPRWAAEVAWEYRSNDSETRLADGTRYPDGNYASNTLYLNGLYHFDAAGNWDPYIGAGIGWQQEIDLDLEGQGPEISYSGDGSVGVQVFAGVNYQLGERWALNAELRYSDFGDIDLEGEGAASGEIDSLDYAPLSGQVGVIFRF